MEKIMDLGSLTSIKLQSSSYPQIIADSLKLIQTSKNIPPTSLQFLDYTALDYYEIYHRNVESFGDDNSLQQTLERISSSYKLTKQQRKGCICKKTKCLKMYCQCFSQGKTCSEECVCFNCSNNLDNIQQVEMVKKQLIDKKQRLNKNNVGCNCQKSNCQKKYCECFNAGRFCNQSCKCHSCQNIDELQKQESLESQFKRI